MIVAMQESASEEQIQQVIEHLVKMGFEVHRSTGVRQTVLGAVGARADFDVRELEVLSGVDQVHRISAPYKLAGRSFRPEGTVVKLRDGVEIGGNKVVVMAGPCSVESREQLFAAAAQVAEAGARVLRGGAFKPRSSPYSFQGLGEDALELLRQSRWTTRPRGTASRTSCRSCSGSEAPIRRVRGQLCGAGSPRGTSSAGRPTPRCCRTCTRSRAPRS